ncbi:MAG: head-tail adaptor protein [Pseudomonadota bacterium]
MADRTPNLNRRMVLEARRTSLDETGSSVTEWDPLGMVFVALLRGSGRLAQAGGREVPLNKARILQRAVSEGAASRPWPGHRYRSGSRTYAILAVGDWDPEGRYLQVQVEEGRV